jgi:hypothetical protein
MRVAGPAAQILARHVGDPEDGDAGQPGTRRARRSAAAGKRRRAAGRRCGFSVRGRSGVVSGSPAAARCPAVVVHPVEAQSASWSDNCAAAMTIG